MTIGIVDNDELTLGVLSAALARCFGDESVAWRCLSGMRTVSLCLDERRRPDVLLMDVSLSDISGIEACRRIRERGAVPPILLITAFPLHRYAADAARAGAQGIVAKRDLRRVREAVARVASGTTWNDDTPDTVFEIASRSHDRLARESGGAADADVVRLSTRETEILLAYAHGLTTRQVSEQIGLSVNTVKTYTRRAMDKLGAGTRGQAIASFIASRRN